MAREILSKEEIKDLMSLVEDDAKAKKKVAKKPAAKKS